MDVSSKVAVCGSEACQPVPVALRPPATFLWEVDPFHLQGGGSGIIENAGVDYILPYWMARYYGVITSEARVQSVGGAEQCGGARFARVILRRQSGVGDGAGRFAAAAALAGRCHADGNGFGGSDAGAHRCSTFRRGRSISWCRTARRPARRHSQCPERDGSERDGGGAAGGADAVQHERNGFGRGRGAGGGGAGRESASAVSGAGVSVRERGVRLRADRCWGWTGRCT